MNSGKMLPFALIAMLFVQCFAIEVVERMDEESELEHEFEELLTVTNSQTEERLDRMALIEILNNLNEQVC